MIKHAFVEHDAFGKPLSALLYTPLFVIKRDSGTKYILGMRSVIVMAKLQETAVVRENIKRSDLDLVYACQARLRNDDTINGNYLRAVRFMYLKQAIGYTRSQHKLENTHNENLDAFEQFIKTTGDALFVNAESGSESEFESESVSESENAQSVDMVDMGDMGDMSNEKNNLNDVWDQQLATIRKSLYARAVEDYISSDIFRTDCVPLADAYIEKHKKRLDNAFLKDRKDVIIAELDATDITAIADRKRRIKLWASKEEARCEKRMYGELEKEQPDIIRAAKCAVDAENARKEKMYQVHPKKRKMLKTPAYSFLSQ